ncbi:secretion system effector C (SseC) like family protein, partial [Vibrio parahaemolyticus VPTS-2010]
QSAWHCKNQPFKTR